MYKMVNVNKGTPGASRGIEDFSLKSLRMWVNKSPTPPVFRSKPWVLNQKKFNKKKG
jgi:hypothetical protein